MLLGRDGVLYFHDPSHSRIQRWSLHDERPLSPIAIGASSSFLAYSGDDDLLYVGYSDRRITRIDAGLPAGETPSQPLPRRSGVS